MNYNFLESLSCGDQLKNIQHNYLKRSCQGGQNTHITQVYLAHITLFRHRAFVRVFKVSIPSVKYCILRWQEPFTSVKAKFIILQRELARQFKKKNSISIETGPRYPNYQSNSKNAGCYNSHDASQFLRPSFQIPKSFTIGGVDLVPL